MNETANTMPSSTLRRVLRWTTITLASVIAVLVLCFSLLLIPVVRERVLSFAVARANSSLPGRLSMGESSWPALGSIEMAEILWTADNDTLLAVGEFTIRVDLRALLSRDIRIHHVLARGLRVDIPAVERRLSSNSETEANGTTNAGFPRAGSISGIPSIEIGRAVVDAPLLRISDEIDIENASLDATIDVTAGASPRFSVGELRAHARDGSWSVDSLAVDLDLRAGKLSGGGRGTLGSRRLLLAIGSAAPDSIDITITPQELVSETDDAGIVVHAGLERTGFSIHTIHFSAAVRMPEHSNLSRVPAFASLLDPVPDFDRVRISANGTVHTQPRFTAHAIAEISVEPWLHDGRAAIRYENGELSIEDVALTGSDVSITGSTTLRDDSTRAELRLVVDGTQTLELIAPGLNLPAGFAAGANATLHVASETKSVVVRIDASGQTESFAVEDLFLDANLSLQDEGKSMATIALQSTGFNLGFATTIERAKDITVMLSPILVAQGAIDRSRSYGTPGTDSQIRYSPVSHDIVVDDVRIRGGAGNYTVNASADSAMSGTYHITCQLPQPPPILTRALAIESRGLDSLRALWTTGDPYDFDVSGEFTGRQTKTIRAVVGFTLPGPAILAPLLPDSTHVEDLGPLRGNLAIDASLTESGPQVSLSGDLNGTDWIESSILKVSRAGETVTVDTVGIAVRAATFGATGTIAAEGLDLIADLSVVDSSFARRFSPTAPDVRFDANARVTGTRGDPVVDITMAGAVRRGAFAAPRVTSRIIHSPAKTRIDVAAPGGIATPFVHLDSLTLQYTSLESGSAVPARINVYTRGKGVSLSQSFVIDTTSGLQVNVDALSLRIAQEDLVASRPFTLTGQSDGLTLAGLDLAGSLGVIQASGSLGGPSTNFACDASISLPDEPASLQIPEHLWPERLELHLRTTEHEINGDIQLDGFSLAHGLQSSLGIEIEMVDDTLRAGLAITDTLNTLLDARVSLPAIVTTYPPALTLQEGPLSFDATLTQYPTAIYFLRESMEVPEEEVARISSRVHIDGTTEEPTGHATATISFPDWPKLSVYQLGLEARLGEGHAVTGPLLERVVREVRGGTSHRLIMGYQLKEGPDEVMFGALGYPLQVSLQPFRIDAVDGEALHAILETKELPLERFDPVLPTDVSLRGLCTIDLAADGPADNPVLLGQITATGLVVSVAQQASFSADGKIDIAGTRRRPKIDGNIDVRRGLIQIPEQRKDLHPTQGNARLLADTASTNDSVIGSPADSVAEGDASDKSEADINVAIRIPERFYVRGRGLDMELGGNLLIENNGMKPVVTGELRALHGTLVLLGRSLRLERGTVNFVGGNEINPELDASLQTYVDQVRIYIILAGTVQEPIIILGSDPEMNEGDIISTLLFGSAYDDLSDDQADLVERRSAEMVAALGAAQLQKNLAGIDVVQFRGADTQDRAGTLTFGKFLNPDVLLSYVYAIDDQAMSFVSLEYFLRGNFKVDTVYGRRNQTGLGFGWARDY